MRRSPVVRAALAALTLPLVSGGVAHAADADAEAAKQTYVRYCGACHGPEGKGDGLVGTFIRPKPTDLTQLEKKNHGKFPFEPTMRAIDGRETVRAHGDPAMPVWGQIFKQEAAPANERAEIQGKLMMITTYLQSIQAK